MTPNHLGSHLPRKAVDALSAARRRLDRPPSSSWEPLSCYFVVEDDSATNRKKAGLDYGIN